jgi:hypothetical protein
MKYSELIGKIQSLQKLRPRINIFLNGYPQMIFIYLVHVMNVVIKN